MDEDDNGDKVASIPSAVCFASYYTLHFIFIFIISRTIQKRNLPVDQK